MGATSYILLPSQKVIGSSEKEQIEDLQLH